MVFSVSKDQERLRVAERRSKKIVERSGRKAPTPRLQNWSRVEGLAPISFDEVLELPKVQKSALKGTNRPSSADGGFLDGQQSDYRYVLPEITDQHKDSSYLPTVSSSVGVSIPENKQSSHTLSNHRNFLNRLAVNQQRDRPYLFHGIRIDQHRDPTYLPPLSSSVIVSTTQSSHTIWGIPNKIQTNNHPNTNQSLSHLVIGLSFSLMIGLLSTDLDEVDGGLLPQKLFSTSPNLFYIFLSCDALAFAVASAATGLNAARVNVPHYIGNIGFFFLLIPFFILFWVLLPVPLNIILVVFMIAMFVLMGYGISRVRVESQILRVCA